MHAAVVGAAAGLCGAAFMAGSDMVQTLLLEHLAGYTMLRVHGEATQPLLNIQPGAFRPWLLVVLPGLGGMLGGIICTLAPETQSGGGGNAMIYAFHWSGAKVRARVIFARVASAIACLGSGGSGGREGPTMQMGGGIGSVVADALRMNTRERRILYIAGVAAGMSAVFRTPLGAALLAVEVLYRDDFEAEALVPAILASVVGYSVVIALFGEGTSLFGEVPRFHFYPAHLHLYIGLAIVVSVVASLFLAALHATHHWADRISLPIWVKPGIGGLALGLLSTAAITLLGRTLGVPAGQGLGLLGSGYGEIQVALTGSSWLPSTWQSVEVLAVLLVCKLLATCATLGFGGSAGDFAPSMVLGGLTGGVVGRALQLLLHDPTISPGAFVLVGMATFYGGIARAPLSSLVMACEMAGSYDLLVPLMLGEGVAFIALRNRSLYSAQVPSQKDSPVHRDIALSDALSGVLVKNVLPETVPQFATFQMKTDAPAMLEAAAKHRTQLIFPVVDEKQALQGIVSADNLSLLAIEAEGLDHIIAADSMQRAAITYAHETLQQACDRLIDTGTRAAVVLDAQGGIVGILEETAIARVYLGAAARVHSS